MKRFACILLVGWFAVQHVQAQTKDTLTLMFQNLLNFPIGGGGIPSREDTFGRIVQYVKPDLAMVCELANAPGNPENLLLTHAFNINGNTSYLHAPFVLNTSTSDNLQQLIYYNSTKLGIRSQAQLPTNLRDVNKYVMYYKDPNLPIHHDTTFIDVYVSHLKASAGPPNDAMRDQEVTVLRNHVNTNPAIRNSIFAADMNVYTNAEPCYQTITTTGTYPFQDPINQPGAWNNNFAFKGIHTQCTRSLQLGGDGAGGGLDDRFDQILISANIVSGANRVRYIPGTYKAVGQDGLHFNNSVNATPANAAVPQYVANALYYMSDHLPVSMDIEITMPAVVPVVVSAFEAEALPSSVALRGKLESLDPAVQVALGRSQADGSFALIGPISCDPNGNFALHDVPPFGFVRYRLQFTDADGNVAYSEERPVWFRGDYLWQAVPNTSGFSLQLPSQASFDGEIIVTDLAGKLLAHKSWAREDDIQHLPVEITGNRGGMLTLTLINRESGWRSSRICILPQD